MSKPNKHFTEIQFVEIKCNLIAKSGYVLERGHQGVFENQIIFKEIEEKNNQQKSSKMLEKSGALRRKVARGQKRKF